MTDTQLIAIPAGGLGLVGGDPIPPRDLIINASVVYLPALLVLMILLA